MSTFAANLQDIRAARIQSITPTLTGFPSLAPIFSQLGHDPSNRRFEPRLQAFQTVEPMHALDVRMPAFKPIAASK
jgi:hypothetical protein